jgi:hypothetical protein
MPSDDEMPSEGLHGQLVVIQQDGQYQILPNGIDGLGALHLVGSDGGHNWYLAQTGLLSAAPEPDVMLRNQIEIVGDHQVRTLRHVSTAPVTFNDRRDRFRGQITTVNNVEYRLLWPLKGGRGGIVGVRGSNPWPKANLTRRPCRDRSTLPTRHVSLAHPWPSNCIFDQTE